MLKSRPIEMAALGVVWLLWSSQFLLYVAGRATTLKDTLVVCVTTCHLVFHLMHAWSTRSWHTGTWWIVAAFLAMQHVVVTYAMPHLWAVLWSQYMHAFVFTVVLPVIVRPAGLRCQWRCRYHDVRDTTSHRRHSPGHPSPRRRRYE